MRTKSLSLIVALLVVGTAVLAVTPTVEAQKPKPTVTMSLNAPGQLVKPLQGAITFTGTVNFVAEVSAASEIKGVQVTYTVTNQPAWASVTVTPTTDVIALTQGAAGAGSAQVTGNRAFQVIVSATDLAPAFQPAIVEIQAATLPSSAFDAGQGKATVPIEADYFALLDLNLGQKIQIQRPQQPANFPLTITNLGNANTRINFEVLEKAANLQVPPPNSVILQSKQAGGQTNAQQITLTIQTPYKNGYLNVVGVVTYKLTSHYALDPKKKGPDENVAVVVTTKGFYVPGPELFGVIGILGVAALFLRRRG